MRRRRSGAGRWGGGGAEAEPAPTIGAVTIGGVAQEGQTLTAAVTGYESDDTVSYQWSLNGSAISGQTGATYLVGEGDEGGTLSVTATVTNNAGVSTATVTTATTAGAAEA